MLPRDRREWIGDDGSARVNRLAGLHVARADTGQRRLGRNARQYVDAGPRPRRQLDVRHPLIARDVFGERDRDRRTRDFAIERRGEPRGRGHCVAGQLLRGGGVAQLVRAFAVKPRARAGHMEPCPHPVALFRRAGDVDRMLDRILAQAGERVADHVRLDRELAAVGDVRVERAAAERVAAGLTPIR
jgi:hypothetical protein